MFENKTIQEIDNLLKSSIENQKKELDEISAQIKLIENRCQILALPFSITFSCFGEEKEEENPPYKLIIKETCLSWDLFKEPNGKRKFRFIYKIFENLYEEDEKISSQLIYIRPTAELPINLRLQLKPFLVGFYQLFAEKALEWNYIKTLENNDEFNILEK